MKKSLVALFLLGSFCLNAQVAQKTYSLNGTFEDKVSDPNENGYLVFEKNKGILEGYFYGTSDDFNDAREGYLPGFFVAKMQNLTIVGDSIFFVLKVTKNDMFSIPVKRTIKTTAEAKTQKCPMWDNNLLQNPSIRKYSGIIKDENTILFKGSIPLLNKVFKKIR